MLGQYVQVGVEELDQAKLPHLLDLKYHGVEDAVAELGTVGEIAALFTGFQQHLYGNDVAA